MDGLTICMSALAIFAPLGVVGLAILILVYGLIKPLIKS